ncbi:MAG: sialate O-acetylesterase [Phycisphaeraceae bacterium]
MQFAGQKKQAVAGKDGKWMVKLDPLEASDQPQGMIVLGGEGRAGISLDDILVGEVWIASGQSNMQWLASKCDVGRVLQAGIAARVEAGEETPPIIREAKVTNIFSALHPIEHATVEWIDDGSSMSAIAYAFAYELYKELGVPIGILNCSFSSTAIEAWVPREGFAKGTDEYTQAIQSQLKASDPATPEHKAAWSAYYAALEQGIKDNEHHMANGQEPQPIAIKPPGNVNGNRAATWLYNARMHPFVPYGVRGAIWNQGYANMNAGITYYDNLHSLAHGWRNNWQQDDLPIYFNQFYTPGKGDGDNHPSFGSTAEMRLGTYLARDISNSGMASQIDIGGSVHYYRKALAGQRLSLHALKNQYGKDVIADGPMFKSYAVQGNELTVSFDHANGGLVVGQVQPDSKLPGVPVLLINDDAEVGLFYIADANQIWHKASVKINGEKVVLTAPGVATPRGVSYATGGIGPQPNLYNQSLLPMTPFTFYDNEMVTSKTWPHDPPKVAGYEPDPNAGGLAYEYRKFPILSTQFRDNAVLQHGQPVKIWGAAKRQYFPDAPGKRVIRFSFDGIEKTIELTPEMDEWSVTLEPMSPSSEPKTLRVALLIDGEVVHERVAENIVIGDVWFVAAPKMNAKLPAAEPMDSVVRVIKRQAKRDKNTSPSRYSVAVSTTPENRFASYWEDVKADSLHGAIAHRIAAQSKGVPVGVIFMQTNPGKGQADVPLKSWIPFWSLKDAPSLADDFAKLGTQYPGAPTYHDNIRRYAKDWQTYWDKYIPKMIATKAVPDGSAWGVIPNKAAADAKSDATQAYNVMVHSFTPAALKGVIFIVGEDTLAGLSEATFDEQFKVLTKSWAGRFSNDSVIEKVIDVADVDQFSKIFDSAVQAIQRDAAPQR